MSWAGAVQHILQNSKAASGTDGATIPCLSLHCAHSTTSLEEEDMKQAAVWVKPAVISNADTMCDVCSKPLCASSDQPYTPAPANFPSSPSCAPALVRSNCQLRRHCHRHRLCPAASCRAAAATATGRCRCWGQPSGQVRQAINGTLRSQGRFTVRLCLYRRASTSTCISMACCAMAAW